MKYAKVEEAADEIARRFDAMMMRPEDRLNDGYVSRVVREKATEVLVEMTEERRRVIVEQTSKASWSESSG